MSDKLINNKELMKEWNKEKNILYNPADLTRGVLCGARVKELPIILEFTSFQDTIMFYKRGRFGLEKVQNSEINVKVVLDMECGNI